MCKEYAAVKQRPALLWLDRACLDQANITESLQYLPVHLAGCKELLILAGPSYTTRMWTLLEIFVFVQMGGDLQKIRVMLIHAESDTALTTATLDAFKAIDVKLAGCTDPRHKEQILGIIETGMCASLRVSTSGLSLHPSSLALHDLLLLAHAEAGGSRLFLQGRAEDLQHACPHHPSGSQREERPLVKDVDDFQYGSAQVGQQVARKDGPRGMSADVWTVGFAAEKERGEVRESDEILWDVRARVTNELRYACANESRPLSLGPGCARVFRLRARNARPGRRSHGHPRRESRARERPRPAATMAATRPTRGQAPQHAPACQWGNRHLGARRGPGSRIHGGGPGAARPSPSAARRSCVYVCGARGDR